MYNSSISLHGNPGPTFTLTAGNGATGFAADKLKNQGNQAVAALITCETYGIRFSFGADPAQDFGHPLAVGGSFLMLGPECVKAFRYVNDTASSNGVLMVTIFY